MKKYYEKPIIIKLEQSMTKFGSPLLNQKVRDNIDGVKIEDLMEYGSPLFVFSEKIIKERYSRAYEAFSSRYPNFEFSWSYKTNYLKSICAIFHKLGSTAEVVSEFEYQKARALGIKGEDIIFNGPYKPYEALEVAVKD